jgi:hypothetical protein
MHVIHYDAIGGGTRGFFFSPSLLSPMFISLKLSPFSSCGDTRVATIHLPKREYHHFNIFYGTFKLIAQVLVKPMGPLIL